MAQGLAFANARVSTYSAHALYAGYFSGQTLVFAGVLQNPRTQYREAAISCRPLALSSLMRLLPCVDIWKNTERLGHRRVPLA